MLLIAGADGERPGWPASPLAAPGLYLVMALTDWLDGFLARRLDAVTRWGSILDAVADRLTMVVPLLYIGLADPPAFPEIPVWVPLWLILLDLVLGSAWLMARWWKGARRPATHHMAGRAGVWLLFTLTLWVLAGLPAWGVIPLAVSGLGLSTGSAALYLHRWYRA